MTHYLVGLDAGNTMTKAVLFDLQGREIGAERRRNPIRFSAPGHTERDADRMWQDSAEAIRALLENAGVAAADIAAVSTSGYGAGLYLVDERGNPTRPGIMSTDSRARDVIDGWVRDRVAASSEQRVQQRLWSGQPAPLLSWIAACEPEVVRRTHRVLFCKDFLRGKLCNTLDTDPTDAGIAGLSNVVQQRYEPEFFASLGIDSWFDKLPDIAPSTAIAGKVTATAAGLTGLLEGTPVVRGVVDVVAAALASGVKAPNQMSVVAGTFSINSTLHASPRLDGLPLLQSPYPIDGLYLATEGSPTSASNFEWYCKSVLGPVVAAAAEDSGRTIYESLSSRVQSAMERANNILFMPFLFGGPNRAPAGFIGLEAAHSSVDIVRAIFEGIAFAHRLDIEALRTGRDVAPVDSIRLTGGAARSAPWAQIFADVLGLPVEITGCSELGALGAVMASAVGIGAYEGWHDAIDNMVHVTQRVVPRPDWQDVYEKKFERFKAHVNALAALNQP
ncbi:FGGY-family carbohydrate kinase [Paraburkholderia sp. SUR17]|uniref:FGGY-family carbohydrate kinase n=1 Tax=Paraburkholderia sp. SUR17 TaxID=3034358 RepID=UPI0024078A35|nr:FGGY-family carbohydrate kinase [Paraburkholderia sp. SUR17]WEY37676.1 carbohydrate kinase [Paraburkholderia sp. SUR17]